MFERFVVATDLSAASFAVVRCLGGLRHHGTQHACSGLASASKQELVQRRDAGDIALMVLGTQGRGLLGEFLVGSVATHVTRRSITPSLLVPPTA